MDRRLVCKVTKKHAESKAFKVNSPFLRTLRKLNFLEHPPKSIFSTYQNETFMTTLEIARTIFSFQCLISFVQLKKHTIEQNDNESGWISV